MSLAFYLFLVTLCLNGLNIFYCFTEYTTKDLFFGSVYEANSVLHTFGANDSLINGFCSFDKLKFITNNVVVHCCMVPIKHELKFTLSILFIGADKFVINSGKNLQCIKRNLMLRLLTSKYSWQSKMLFELKKFLEPVISSNFMRLFVIKFYLNCKVEKCYYFRRFITYWIYCNYFNHLRSKISDCNMLSEHSISRFVKAKKSGLELFIILMKSLFFELMYFIDISRLIGSCSNYAGDGPKRIFDRSETR